MVDVSAAAGNHDVLLIEVRMHKARRCKLNATRPFTSNE